MMCPYCNAKAVEDVDYDFRSNYDGRVCRVCMDCHAEWVDIYELVDTELMFDGREEVR